LPALLVLFALQCTNLSVFGAFAPSLIHTDANLTQILARLTFGRPQADAIRAQEAARAARAEAKQASTEEAKVKAMAIIASALEDEAKKTAAAGLILMNGKMRAGVFFLKFNKSK